MNIKRHFKLLGHNLLYAAAALLTVPIIITMLLMLIWDTPSCDQSSEAVTYARSLSQERLSKLYADMERFSKRDDLPIDGYQAYQEGSYVPEEFADLKVVKVRPSEGNIMVKGCFDHYIYLRFMGIGPLANHSDRKQIILNWGEHPPNTGTQVLWSDDF